MFFELDHLAFQTCQICPKLFAALLAGCGEVRPLEDPPVTKDGCDDFFEMLAQVVDAVFGHQHAVATKVRHSLTGHPEVLDDVGNGFQRLIGCHIECRAAHVPVEDHVQVLVRGDAGQHPVGDRVIAHLAGIAVADPGGEFLK